MSRDVIMFLLGIWCVVGITIGWYVIVSISNISKIITEKLYPTKKVDKDTLNPTQWC